MTITVKKSELRTYDANNAKTYILDAGDYYFTAATDSHNAVNNILAAKGYTVAGAKMKEIQAVNACRRDAVAKGMKLEEAMDKCRPWISCPTEAEALREASLIVDGCLNKSSRPFCMPGKALKKLLCFPAAQSIIKSF